MKKPSKLSAINGTGRNASQAGQSGHSNGAPTFNKFEPRIKPNPRETAQEAVHQVMPKDAPNVLKGPFTQIPAADDVKPPLRAARGDDDLMSEPEKHS